MRTEDESAAADDVRLTQKASGQKGARSRSRSRSLAEPAMPIALGHNLTSWCWARPSTTVMGDVRVPPPGYRGGHDERAESMMAQSVRVELHELATLQDFPPDHPWQGNRTSVASQIGNACPASLVEAVVRELLR